MTHLLAVAGGAFVGVFFASSTQWAIDARAWLRRQTIGRLGL